MPGDSNDSSDASDGHSGEPPSSPDLPAYVVDPLGRQPPERLDAIAAYARRLAEYKRARGPSPSASGGSTDRDRPQDTAGNELGDGPRAVDGTELPDSEDSDRGRVVSASEVESLSERGVATDPREYEGVPDDGAYVTIKETKPGYRYYYWQWRDGETWRNQYIGPVSGPD